MTQKFILLMLSLIVAQASYGQVLAVVGKKKITLKEFQKKYKVITTQSLTPPTPELFLEDLVRFELGVQEANKRKLKNDPIVQQKFKEELYKALLEKELGEKVQKIKVAKSEMKRHYRKNPELRSSHILIQTKPNAKAKELSIAKKRATTIYNEVKKSKRSFKNLVRLYTDDNLSKAAGGDIGYQTIVSLDKSYYSTMKQMKVGQLKGPVRTTYGYHIIKLTGRRSYQEANKNQLRLAVFEEKRAVLFNKYFARLKKKYSIKVNKDLVKKLK